MRTYSILLLNVLSLIPQVFHVIFMTNQTRIAWDVVQEDVLWVDTVIQCPHLSSYIIIYPRIFSVLPESFASALPASPGPRKNCQRSGRPRPVDGCGGRERWH